MKKQSTAVTLLVMTLSCLISQATLYGPSKTMSYFMPYKGQWTDTHKDKADKDNEFKETTVASFSHLYNVFTINKYFEILKPKTSAIETLTIQDQQSDRCNATLYRNKRSYYFSGIPDKKSKIFVLKNIKPMNKTENFLIIDFSGCPKKPPIYKLSHEKPKAPEK